MSEIEILSKFKRSSIDFLDELISVFPSEPDLIILRVVLKDQIPIADFMNHFIYKVLPLDDLVQSKDDRFFTENDVLFGGLDGEKQNMFKRLWLSQDLDQEDRDVIWKWFETFNYIAKKCVKIRAKNHLL
jgi:hypothetical protein